MNETEKYAFNQLLDILSERLGAAGCNDFTLPVTEEAKQLVIAVEMDTDPSQSLEDATPTPQIDYRGNPCYYTTDFVLLDYLRGKLFK